MTGKTPLESYNRGMKVMSRTFRRHALSRLLQGANHLLWPAVCLNCGGGLHDDDGELCRTCWDELHQSTAGYSCPRCGRDTSPYGMIKGACGACRDERLHFEGMARVGVYGRSLQQLILKFKNGCTQLDRVMTGLVSAAFEGAGFREHVDMVVPVPLHWRRRLSRGYNQSAILAKSLTTARIGISTDLVRIRHTRQQPAMVSPASRRRNVANAFTVRRRHPFADRTVCLVDDVKTTGATLNECAKVLKEAGARHVYAVVLAVAGQGN